MYRTTWEDISVIEQAVIIAKNHIVDLMVVVQKAVVNAHYTPRVVVTVNSVDTT